MKKRIGKDFVITVFVLLTIGLVGLGLVSAHKYNNENIAFDGSKNFFGINEYNTLDESEGVCDISIKDPVDSEINDALEEDESCS